MGKNSQKPKYNYRTVVRVSKILSPVLKGLYYLFIVLIVLSGIVALIMPIVNVPVEDMLLPPYMSETETGYSITIGNGIRVDALRADVTLGDIKTVVYAQLMLAAAAMCILAPISLFLSKLTKNLGRDELYTLRNSRLMMYIGLTVAVGYTFVGIAHDFYNYLLVRTYVPDPQTIHLSMQPDLGGVLVGLLIIVFAYIYAHACEKHTSELDAAKAESSDLTVV